MNSARRSGNHPLDLSFRPRVARVYVCTCYTLTNERSETWRNGPKADTIHAATTNGSPIVSWLLIRYLVLLLSNSPYTLRARARQPTVLLSPAPTAVGVSTVCRDRLPPTVNGRTFARHRAVISQRRYMT